MLPLNQLLRTVKDIDPTRLCVIKSYDPYRNVRVFLFKKIMTEEQFNKKRSEMTDSALIELCEKTISELAKTGGRSFRMCVPPMITDTDMVLSELVRRFKVKAI